MGRILSCCIAAPVATSAPMGSALAGKTLQIHFMNVGQGDGAILVTPGGKTQMFDDGVVNNCDHPLGYLDEIGVRNIDIQIASHYHADHIGCAAAVLAQHPLTCVAYDRGYAFPSDDRPGEYFIAYRDAFDGKRIEANAGDSIKLDEDAEHSVVIRFVAVNGNGLATENENDLSLVAVIEHAGFRAEIGGDLSGEDTPGSASSTWYRDIETSVADLVGEIDLYKVHHHCSAYNTNETWLSKTKPTVAVTSVGNGNRYGHPAEDCVNRLHSGEVKRIYWTENGKGVDPEPPIDVDSGAVVVEVEAGQPQFPVLYQSGRQRESFRIKSVASESPSEGDGGSAADTFAWSKNSSLYHYRNCAVVRQISKENREGSWAPRPHASQRLPVASQLVPRNHFLYSSQWKRSPPSKSTDSSGDHHE